MKPRLALLLLVGCLLGVASAPAQEAAGKKGALLITNARVGAPETLVSILVAGGKIRAIGPDLRAPRSTPRLDARGARVAPGRIDAWAGVAGGDPLGRAVDALDRHDAHLLDEALRGGVTTVFLSPGGGTGLLGVGSIVKLRPGAGVGEMLVVEQAAVVASLGGLDASPLARASAWGELRGALEGARRYREALGDHDEALKAWLQEVAAVASATAAGVATPTTARPPAAPARPGEAKKEKERPRPPTPNRTSVLLLRALDRELPLRVQAHRAEDLVAALEVQREFGLRLVIEGGLEAHRVADLLRAREALLVLGDPLRPTDARARPPLTIPDNAGALRARGVPFALGTGDLAASRFVELGAALAAGQGLDPAAAEEAITARAAEAIGLGERLGRVAVGYDADLVLLAREPLATAPAVEVVIIDGEVVWRRSP